MVLCETILKMADLETTFITSEIVTNSDAILMASPSYPSMLYDFFSMNISGISIITLPSERFGGILYSALSCSNNEYKV